MKINNIVLAILLFCPMLSCQNKKSSETKKGIIERASWHIFRGDANLSGVASGELPPKNDLLWSFQTGAAITSTPVIGLKKVFVGSTDGKVYSLNIFSGEKIWEFDTADEIQASPLLLDSTIYIGNLAGEFFSINANTGKLNWKNKIMRDIYGSANYVKEKKGGILLFIGSYDSKMYCLDAKNGKLKWSYSTGNYINGAPAIDKNLIVFGGCDEKLHVVNIYTGVKVAEVETKSYIPGSPAFVDGKSYLGHYGNKLMCIDVNKKAILWEFIDKENHGPFFSSPAIGKDVVIAGSRDNNVYCIDRKTGTKKWSFKTRDEVDSSPVIVKDKVVVGSLDGRIYVLDINSGKEIWSYEIGSAISGAPAVAGGIIFIGADDGRIYSFGEKL